MGNFRHRMRKKRHKPPPHGAKPQAQRTTSTAAKSNPKSGKAGANGARSRWLYDVRQYALLTDATGHVLLLQLPKTYADDAANAWTLPGGKLEPDDEPGAGLLREIAEETGLTPTLLGPCGVARWSNRNSKKLGIFWRAQLPAAQPSLKLSGEHQRAVWVHPAEAAEFPFHRPEMLDILRQALAAPSPTP